MEASLTGQNMSFGYGWAIIADAIAPSRRAPVCLPFSNSKHFPFERALIVDLASRPHRDMCKIPRNWAATMDPPIANSGKAKEVIQRALEGFVLRGVEG